MKKMNGLKEKKDQLNTVFQQINLFPSNVSELNEQMRLIFGIHYTLVII